jgi:hypothetical protein
MKHLESELTERRVGLSPDKGQRVAERGVARM